MDESARRIGENEAVFREVNEQIDSLNRRMAAVRDQPMRIVCECGDLQCARQLVVGMGDYERVRSDAALFLVAPGHELPDVERVVRETDEYNVVRKREGMPAEVARETDPRGA